MDFIGRDFCDATGTQPSSGWAVTDKIFGVLDKAGNLYNEIRYPRVPAPGDPNYEAYLAQQRALQQSMFGLPAPFGLLLLVGGVSLVVFVVYKVVVKKS